MTEVNRQPISIGPLRAASELAPAWREFIRYCAEMGHGEIERLSIQDGVPVLAEVTRKKIKFHTRTGG